MKRRTIIKALSAALPGLRFSRLVRASAGLPFADSTGVKNISFEPTWESLQQYSVPSWFRDAKFGIWAHWGPQCQAAYGDWYARSMYIEGSRDYKYHRKKYGHPSVFGFKDVINTWKAENWDPESLVSLYKKAGAKYFMALANHHDNFDTFNSKHQPWNATAIGPKKDLMRGWADAARGQGLRFGVSVHAAHAWTFYEKAVKADRMGSHAGIPYDGRLTASEGKGTWWDGLDPQMLYAQQHVPSPGADNQQTFYEQWDWSHGVTVPDSRYCEKFFDRTIDLIDQYKPDIIYFDDTVLPLYPISDVGLRIAAHFYNINQQWHGGKLEAVINGKILNEMQQKCLVWDIERGQSDKIEPLPWQTDTCLGEWHYDKTIFEKHRYKTARTVIQRLVDVVSKNGNLLLNVPVKGDGTIDTDEEKIVHDIAEWMSRNSEAIFETRPWKICGEGPALASATPLKSQGFNEGSGKPFGNEDVRFTTKKGVLYAISLGAPRDGRLLITSLAERKGLYKEKVGQVILCATGEVLKNERTDAGLLVYLPESMRNQDVYAVKILSE